MPTLILSARHTDDTQLLWRACVANGWNVVRATGWQVPEIHSDSVAIYGEPLFAMRMASALGLSLVDPPVDWLPTLPEEIRGREVRLSTLGEARSLETRAFIKPAEEKSFDARIYENGSALPASGLLPQSMPVLIQGIVGWEIELRCFVLNRQVLTLSPYWRRDRSARDENGVWIATDRELEEARAFCECVLRDPRVSVPNAVVVDVGIAKGHGWAVIESNAAYSSGIYGCDPASVLPVLLGACRRSLPDTLP